MTPYATLFYGFAPPQDFVPPWKHDDPELPWDSEDFYDWLLKDIDLPQNPYDRAPLFDSRQTREEWMIVNLGAVRRYRDARDSAIAHETGARLVTFGYADNAFAVHVIEAWEGSTFLESVDSLPEITNKQHADLIRLASRLGIPNTRVGWFLVAGYAP